MTRATGTVDPDAKPAVQSFPRLFEPLSLGPLTLPNRLVMAPMGTGLDDEDGMNDAAIEYYRRRAAGGIGTITVEATLVDPRTDGPEPRLHNTQHLPGMRRLADVVRREGSVVGIQLLHPGRQAELGARYAPSAIPLNSVSPVPQALTAAGIDEIFGYYVRSAALAREAGFQFVEIHGAHGYLPSDFLSPIANHRSDQYGGDLERRARFGRELVRALRAADPSMPVIYRLSGDEGLPGGITIEDSVQMSRWLEQDGVACVSVSAGNWRSLEVTLAPMFMRRGHLVDLAATVTAAVGIPVIAVGRLDDPELAERVLSDGAADLIAVGRGLIADADWAAKVRAGSREDVRPCIACNACVDLVGRGGEVRCAVNPEVGREHEWKPRPADPPKRVAVVGSGPAGLEAARVAAMRGHAVTLFERDERIGGKLEVASSAPSKADVLRFRDYEELVLQRLGVEVRTGREVRPGDRSLDGFDVVVVAIGASAMQPPIPGIDGPNVHDAQAFLRCEVPFEPGDRVVVIGGSATACETAELLTDQGAAVAILEMQPAIGIGIEAITRRYLVRALRRAGVDIRTNTHVTRIESHRVLFTGPDRQLGSLPADHVALAVGWKPRGELLADHSDGAEVIVIGDAKTPADFVAAVNAGADAGLAV